MSLSSHRDTFNSNIKSNSTLVPVHGFNHFRSHSLNHQRQLFTSHLKKSQTIHPKCFLQLLSPSSSPSSLSPSHEPTSQAAHPPPPVPQSFPTYHAQANSALSSTAAAAARLQRPPSQAVPSMPGPRLTLPVSSLDSEPAPLPVQASWLQRRARVLLSRVRGKRRVLVERQV